MTTDPMNAKCPACSRLSTRALRAGRSENSELEPFMSADRLAELERRLRESFARALRRSVAGDPVWLRFRTSFFGSAEDQNGISSSRPAEPPRGDPEPPAGG
jgi:hypothetical protein